MEKQDPLTRNLNLLVSAGILEHSSQNPKPWLEPTHNTSKEGERKLVALVAAGGGKIPNPVLWQPTKSRSTEIKKKKNQTLLILLCNLCTANMTPYIASNYVKQWMAWTRHTRDFYNNWTLELIAAVYQPGRFTRIKKRKKKRDRDAKYPEIYWYFYLIFYLIVIHLLNCHTNLIVIHQGKSKPLTTEG